MVWILLQSSQPALPPPNPKQMPSITPSPHQRQATHPSHLAEVEEEKEHASHLAEVEEEKAHADSHETDSDVVVEH